MFLPILAFSVVLLLFTTEILSSNSEEKQTPEQELKEAIAKYVSQTVKTPKE